jgi:phytoene dehydrogenase-like protein
VAIGHPLDDGTAVVARGDVATTADGLDAADRPGTRPDRPARPGLGRPDARSPRPVPDPDQARQAIRLARFGWQALPSASWLVRRFRGERARALFAGAAAHSQISLSEPVSAAAALVMLATAHADGWPLPVGGAERVAEALAAEVERLGGTIETGRRVLRFDDLPPARVVLFDTGVDQLLSVAGRRLSSLDRRLLRRFRPGPGTFKLDLALDGPIPWRAAELAEAGTVHVGGSFAEIARAEADVVAGRVADRPSCCSPSRAGRSFRVPAMARRSGRTATSPTARPRT